MKVIAHELGFFDGRRRPGDVFHVPEGTTGPWFSPVVDREEAPAEPIVAPVEAEDEPVEPAVAAPSGTPQPLPVQRRTAPRRQVLAAQDSDLA